MPRDWPAWHRAYDDPGSRLSARLAVVQHHVRGALDAAPPGPVRVVSMCAGEGRDLLGVLVDHPRRGDVTARLVELDPRNARAAELACRAGRLHGVSVVEADASTTDAYAGAVPAHLVLACGVFGNVTDDDVRTTVATLPTLCAPGATVIWTRYPRDAAILPRIDGWFADAGFTRQALDTGPGGTGFGVGVHRLAMPPPPFRPGTTMFTFLADPDPAGPRA